jgi:hypothetical protein
MKRFIVGFIAVAALWLIPSSAFATPIKVCVPTHPNQTVDAPEAGGECEIGFEGNPFEPYLSVYIGEAGPKGETGAQGPEGKEGPKGTTGSIGATGPEGPKGSTGATGPEGKSFSVGSYTTRVHDVNGENHLSSRTVPTQIIGFAIFNPKTAGVPLECVYLVEPGKAGQVEVAYAKLTPKTSITVEKLVVPVTFIVPPNVEWTAICSEGTTSESYSDELPL